MERILAKALSRVATLETAGREMEVVAPFMRKHKFKLLGNGSEGSAWTDGKTVLKVMEKSSSAPYLAFIKQVIAHPNEHYPKILGVNTSVNLKGIDLVSVSIEPLKEVSRAEHYTLAAVFYLAMQDSGCYWLIDPDDEDYFEDDENDHAEEDLTKAKKQSSLIKVLAHLMKISERNSGMRFDANNVTNVMKRGSTFVVVDPFCREE
jgi:hypothetical protein